MAHSKTEFWNSKNFWEPALITAVIGGIAAILVGFIIWEGVIESNREKAFVYKDTLFRSVSGGKTDGKEAYIKGLNWTILSGQLLSERAKQGIKLEDTIKEVRQTQAEFGRVGGEGERKNQKKIEEYKEYLRSD